MITMDNNNINKQNQINKTTNVNNNDSNVLYNNSQLIEPIKKKGEVNISKKVFIKPKIDNFIYKK